MILFRSYYSLIKDATRGSHEERKCNKWRKWFHPVFFERGPEHRSITDGWQHNESDSPFPIRIRCNDIELPIAQMDVQLLLAAACKCTASSPLPTCSLLTTHFGSVTAVVGRSFVDNRFCSSSRFPLFESLHAEIQNKQGKVFSRQCIRP